MHVEADQVSFTGTNFEGADNAFEEIDWNVIEKYSNGRKIEWNFNPPTAAWWGGWWERLIGMLKNILRRVLGKASLSYEEMVTVLCDCESTLNSRPLTYVSDDPSDLKPLTPSMFLHDLRTEETPDFDIINGIDLNARVKYRQEVMENLRKRFRKEYLSQLVLKSSKDEKRVLKEGDIVMIGDDSKKRIDWPMARVEKLIVGRGNIVRVAILKTEKGTLKRPIQRIYPLELESRDNSIVPIESETLKDVREKMKKKVENPETCQPKKCEIEPVKTRSGRVSKQPDLFQAT